MEKWLIEYFNPNGDEEQMTFLADDYDHAEEQFEDHVRELEGKYEIENIYKVAFSS